MKISETFTTTASSLLETLMSHSGVAGFRVPIYQREYNWGKEEITRLFQDIFTGILSLEKDSQTVTYIGSIILLAEKTSIESTFEGSSFSIIDGQQRLTTLIISCCLLQEMIANLNKDLTQDSILSKWLVRESKKTLDDFWDCIIGRPAGRKWSFENSFPRIVRQDKDVRSVNKIEGRYYSNIAKYVIDFAYYIENGNESSFTFVPITKDENYKNFLLNIEYIREELKKIFLSDGENDFPFPNPEKLIDKDSYRNALYKKMIDEDIHPIKKDLKSNFPEDLKLLLTLLSFSRFLLDRVAITRVETETEKYAFDIFDSLNTTGEPLTAFETLKPLIIKHEAESRIGFNLSSSNADFKKIESYLNSIPTALRQKQTKEIVVQFALYLTGKKISESLNSQRNFLRIEYTKLRNIDEKRLFTSAMSQVVEFRRRFWQKNQLQNELRSLTDEKELILCSLDFIREMKISLAYPILNRYFINSEETGNWFVFAEAVKAITAFILLRRSATGGTQGIDTDFRALMKIGSKNNISNNIPLKIGNLNNPNEIPSIDNLKSYLRSYLAQTRLNIITKETWLYRFKSLPIYDRAPQPLIRFLILCAFHNSIVDNEHKHLLKKESRHNQNREYLNMSRWQSEHFKTIEHIAPEQPKSDGWEKNIYIDPNLKHTIGNLTLLPEKENSTVGNKGWKIKKLFYKAFSSETSDDLDLCIEEARKCGMDFGKKTTELLLSGMSLPLVSNISEVEVWNDKIIKQRTENLGELIWYEIAPWVGFSK